MPRRIQTSIVVAAVNFGVERDNVLAHGKACAERLGAALHLVHVIEPTHWLLRKVLDDASVDAHERDVRAKAECQLEKLAASCGATFDVRIGKPAEQVLTVVKERGAGLLVCGVGDPKDGLEFVRGGTADRLLRLTPIPIFVVGPEEPRAIRNVLAATGLGPGGACAVATGLEFLDDPEGTVHAVYMAALPSVLRGYAGDVVALNRRLEEEARAELHGHIAAIALPEGRKPVVEVFHGNLETTPAEQTILAEARERHADLIVLALGGRRFLSAIIGKVSDKVIRALPCSLIGIPDAWVNER